MYVSHENECRQEDVQSRRMQSTDPRSGHFFADNFTGAELTARAAPAAREVLAVNFVFLYENSESDN